MRQTVCGEPLGNLCGHCVIVDQQMKPLVGLQSGYHLYINFLHLLQALWPRLFVMRPGQPGGRMGLPFCRHSVA